MANTNAEWDMNYGKQNRQKSVSVPHISCLTRTIYNTPLSHSHKNTCSTCINDYKLFHKLCSIYVEFSIFSDSTAELVFHARGSWIESVIRAFKGFTRWQRKLATIPVSTSMRILQETALYSPVSLSSSRYNLTASRISEQTCVWT